MPEYEPVWIEDEEHPIAFKYVDNKHRTHMYLPEDHDIKDRKLKLEYRIARMTTNINRLKADKAKVEADYDHDRVVFARLKGMVRRAWGGLPDETKNALRKEYGMMVDEMELDSLQGGSE